MPDGPVDQGTRPARYGRRRAWSLLLVHVLFGIHIAHWRLNGTTLAPLELNELMVTLELGIVTAGFLFMLTALVATMFFGRFFCSWGCHILALQDACHWLLTRMKIRPKPLRSRMLLWVPFLAVVHMFIWPQLARLAAGDPLPSLHVVGAEGQWGSFLTDDFWRNLPPVWVALMTFAVVGFACVYALGSRSFCTYGCPYGTLFAWADRLAAGRIRVRDDCRQCGLCTAACTSHIPVHKEFHEHGMVVSSACLKDLDCLEACPNEAAYYGFGPLPKGKGLTKGSRFVGSFDYSWREELLAAVVMLATVFTFRGLYNVVPFLMTLGLGAIFASAAVTAARLFAGRDVRYLGVVLARAGRWRPAAAGFLAVYTLITLFSAHSAWIRWNESQGWAAVKAMEQAEEGPGRAGLAHEAWSHLDSAYRWGLMVPFELHAGRMRLAAMLGHGVEFRKHAAVVSQRFQQDAAALLELGLYRAAAGDVSGAIADLQRVLELDPQAEPARLELERLRAQ